MAALGELVSNSARRVLRLRANGRSHLYNPPKWLDPATNFDLYLLAQTASAPVQTSNSPTRLVVGAQPLFSAAPDIFEQLRWFGDDLNPQDTAVSLFEQSLRDGVGGQAQSDFIDRNILGSFADFSQVLDMGFDSISLNGGSSPAVEITRPALEVVERLAVQAPEPRKVIVSGTLDAVRVSKRSFLLEVRGGRTIRGFYSPLEVPIQKFLGEKIALDAEAVFRPSGDVSFIKASNIRRAGENDAIWNTVPKAAPRSFEELQPKRVVAAGGSAFAHIFGAWPGDESDEEIEEMLANLR